MAVQTGRTSSPLDRLSGYFWWTEQKLATLLAIVLGTLVGLALGALRATKAIAPHFTSVAGAKRLYYGDPGATLSSQSRAYVNKSFTSAKLKPSGYGATLSSTPAEKTAVPTMMNGQSSSHPASKTQEISDGTSKYATKLQDSAPKLVEQTKDYAGSTAQTVKDYASSATTQVQEYTSSATTQAKEYTSGATNQAKEYLPKEITPEDSKKSGLSVTPTETEGEEAETETEDEGGSEYTASSTPTTPRSSVLAPTDTPNGTEKKKKKKKLGKRIKKTFSKIADAITPSTHTT